MKKRHNLQNVEDNNRKNEETIEEMTTIEAINEIFKTEKAKKLEDLLKENCNFERYEQPDNSGKLKKLLNILKAILPCC